MMVKTLPLDQALKHPQWLLSSSPKPQKQPSLRRLPYKYNTRSHELALDWAVDYCLLDIYLATSADAKGHKSDGWSLRYKIQLDESLKAVAVLTLTCSWCTTA